MLTPTPGQDYPRTWNEFLDWFATEEACLTFLEKLRWPHGFICPRCGNTGDVYRASRTRLMCRACQYQGTVTSGTIFDKTRTPLRVWLAAAWYLTSLIITAYLTGGQRSFAENDAQMAKVGAAIGQWWAALG